MVQRQDHQHTLTIQRIKQQEPGPRLLNPVNYLENNKRKQLKKHNVDKLDFMAQIFQQYLDLAFSAIFFSH